METLFDESQRVRSPAAIPMIETAAVYQLAILLIIIGDEALEFGNAKVQQVAKLAVAYGCGLIAGAGMTLYPAAVKHDMHILATRVN